MADYYYTKDGERKGPVPEAELAGLIQTGAVPPTDYYWTQGMDDWKLVSEASFASPAATTSATEIAPSPVVEHQPVSETAQPAATPPGQSPNPFDTPVATESPFGSSASTEITPTSAAQPASPAMSAPTPATSVFGTGSVIGDSHSDTVFVKDVANALPKPLWLILPAVISILVGIPYLLFFLLGAIYIWIGVLLFQANGGLENARRTGSARELMKALSKINTLFVIVGVMTLISIVLGVIALIFIFAGAANSGF